MIRHTPRLDLDSGATRLRRLIAASSAPDHLYGPLEAHLVGTARLLAGWQAPGPLCLAGLFHAAYSTDGRDGHLLPVSARPKLSALIGKEAELLVYLYCACDRAVFYPALEAAGDVILRDRFTGRRIRLRDADAASLCLLTAANELELMSHGPAHWRAYGDQLGRLLANKGFKERLSPPASAALRAQLADTFRCGDTPA